MAGISRSSLHLTLTRFSCHHSVTELVRNVLPPSLLSPVSGPNSALLGWHCRRLAYTQSRGGHLNPTAVVAFDQVQQQRGGQRPVRRSIPPQRGHGGVDERGQVGVIPAHHRQPSRNGHPPVSYTHLTLPTKRIV